MTEKIGSNDFGFLSHQEGGLLQIHKPVSANVQAICYLIIMYREYGQRYQGYK